MSSIVIPRFVHVNYTPGRTSKVDLKKWSVSMVTIHVTEGSADSVVSWFNNPTAQASAHYQVRKDGTIDQFVKESDQAWHNGRVIRPTAPLVLKYKGVNPNLYSIGIEHEGDGMHPMTAKQEVASLQLCREICKRNYITMDRVHIVGHHEVFADKTCPGKIDVSMYVSKLNDPQCL